MQMPELLLLSVGTIAAAALERVVLHHVDARWDEGELSQLRNLQTLTVIDSKMQLGFESFSSQSLTNL